ncbi:SH3 domain protein, partial [Cooperia oncophora]
PTASPSLVDNKDRFGGLLDEYSRRSTPPLQHPVTVRTATAIFKFDAKSPKELSLNRGDVVRIQREVDANWLEGERNGRSGLFPRSYVQGELVTLRREIDENWLEGTNHLGEIGIFPRSYVRLLEDIPNNVNEHSAYLQVIEHSFWGRFRFLRDD